MSNQSLPFKSENKKEAEAARQEAEELSAEEEEELEFERELSANWNVSWNYPAPEKCSRKPKQICGKNNKLTSKSRKLVLNRLLKKK